MFLGFIALVVLDMTIRCDESCEECYNVWFKSWDVLNYSPWTADCQKCVSDSFYLSEDAKTCVQQCPFGKGPIDVNDIYNDGKFTIEGEEESAEKSLAPNT